MKTILIVEDEYAAADNLAELLTDEGYKVFTARDGAEGLARLDECHPDLVLLDVMMPIVDGLEMLKRMRLAKAWEDVPVVLMTASPRPEKQLGYTDYIAKPFHIDSLLARVRRHIDGINGGLTRDPRAQAP